MRGTIHLVAATSYRDYLILFDFGSILVAAQGLDGVKDLCWCVGRKCLYDVVLVGNDATLSCY